jgi:hypothetical protein
MLRSVIAGLKRGRAAFRQRFHAFDDRLDAWAARHWPVLRVLGYALAFVLLFGGVALHAWQTGFARVAAATCGPACLALPGYEYAAAALCGTAAILFVKLYAKLTAAMQRVFVDPFEFVRPEPPPAQVPGWVLFLHVLIGIAMFFVIAGIGQIRIPGMLDRLFEVSVESESGFRVWLGDYGGAEFAVGWWAGGRAVLEFFWLKYPRGGTVARAPDDPWRQYEAELKARGGIDDR